MPLHAVSLSRPSGAPAGKKVSSPRASPETANGSKVQNICSIWTLGRECEQAQQMDATEHTARPAPKRLKHGGKGLLWA